MGGAVLAEEDSEEEVTENTAVAKIGDAEYSTLAEAIAAVPANGQEPTTIVLQSDAVGGVVVNGNKNIVLDLNNHNYNVKKGVGSSGTETNGMQLILGSKVVIKNGSLSASKGSGINFLIKNYSDLTLENVIMDASNVNSKQVGINNCGVLTVNGEETTITAPKNGYAITTGNYVKDAVVKTVINAGKIDNVYTEGSFWNVDGATNKDDCIVATEINGGEIGKVGIYYWDDTKDLKWSFKISENTTVGTIDDFAASVGTEYYKSLSDAIGAAGSEEATIKLVNDSSLDNTEVVIDSDKNITLDLNGYTISDAVIEVSGNLNVMDSTVGENVPVISNDHKGAEYNSGKISGTIKAFGSSNITISSGTIECSNRTDNNDGIAISASKEGSNITINGGYIIGIEGALGVRGKTTAIINGGVLEGIDNAALAGNGTPGNEGTNVTINGGTLIGNIQSNGFVACGIYQPQDGTLVMNGGTIYANGGVGILTRNGKVTINGGTINTTGNVIGKVGDSRVVVGCKAVIFDQSAKYPSGESYTNAETHINGGTFNSEAEPLEVIKDDIQTPYVFEVTGGKFSSDVSEYVSPGYYFDKIDSTVKKGETNVKDTAQAVTTTVKLEGLEKTLREQQDKTGYDSSKADKYEVVVTSPSAEDKNVAEKVEKDENASREMYDIRVNKISGGTVTEVNLTNQKVTITLGKAIADGTTPTVHHIDKGGAQKVEGVKVSADRKSITFTATSFSTFIVDAQYANVDAGSITGSINVNFENANVSGTRAEYDIVLNAESGKTINEFVSSQFVFDKGGDTVSYEIQPSEFVNMTVNGDKYEFNMDGKSYSSATGNKIVLGKLIITGTGDYNFTVDTADKDKIQVHTTKVSDNIVNDYTAAGGTIEFTGNSYNNSNDGNGAKSEASGTLKPATKDLTVNVAFPNTVENKDTKYQDMKVKVSGGDLAEPIEISLGNDYIDTANTSVAWDDTSDVKYVVKVNDTLTENTVYNVEVSGAGYRTYRYNVNMGDSNKSINVWNNVKDVAASVEEGKFETNTTFLAGDIVADGKINIYDLSAVVSYFGTTGLSVDNHPEYAKYDLNRDGKIDSKDIAYVLVSWGE